MKFILIVICGLIAVSGCRHELPGIVTFIHNDDGTTYTMSDTSGNKLNTVQAMIEFSDYSWYNVGGHRKLDSKYEVQGGKWGFVGSISHAHEFKIITGPIFDDFLPFGEDLAAVRVDDRWGFVDTAGQWAIPARFDAGLMKPANVDGWYGTYSKGTTWVSENGKSLRIDKKGVPSGSLTYDIDASEIFRNTVSRPEFYPLLAKTIWKAAWFKENGRWGVLRDDEVILFPAILDVPKPFRPFGDSLIWLYDSSQFGLWARSGRWVIAPQFEDVRVYASHAWVNKKGSDIDDLLLELSSKGNWGLVDSLGKIIIESGKDGVSFGASEMPVKVNGKWKYVWKGIYLDKPVQYDPERENPYHTAMAAVTGEGAEEVERDIRTFLDIKAGELFACYEQERKKQPDLKGMLRTKITLANDGRVQHIDFVKNTIGGIVSECIREKIAAWVFPIHAKGAMVVENTFVYTP